MLARKKYKHAMVSRRFHVTRDSNDKAATFQALKTATYITRACRGNVNTASGGRRERTFKTFTFLTFFPFFCRRRFPCEDVSLPSQGRQITLNGSFVKLENYVIAIVKKRTYNSNSNFMRIYFALVRYSSVVKIHITWC